MTLPELVALRAERVCDSERVSALNQPVASVAEPEGASDEPAPAPEPRLAAPVSPAPGRARRLAARLALLAFGLYHVPLVLNDFPTLGGDFRQEGLAHTWGHVFCPLGVWIARHVFGLTGDMTFALEGDNGDTAEEYCRLLVSVLVAAIAAAVWTYRDRLRPGARWVEGALHVLLRYAIALGLASYAVAKLLPVQFGEIPAASLERHVGDLSPSALAWTFMEYSPFYSMFAGVMELAIVLLVSFRRTTTLGALICIPVMINVALMNFCFGVPVKLFSSMMVVSAAVLVLYDARSLACVLALRRPPPPRALLPVLRSRRLYLAGWGLKIVLIGGVLASSFVAMVPYVTDREVTPLDGTWEAHSFVVDGRELVTTTDPARWRRLIVGRRGAAIRLADDTMMYCQRAQPAADMLRLTCRRPAAEATLHGTRTGGQLQLDGTFGGAHVTASFALRDEGELPLRKARFRWTMDVD